jgi:hypothetical protein
MWDKYSKTGSPTPARPTSKALPDNDWDNPTLEPNGFAAIIASNVVHTFRTNGQVQLRCNVFGVERIQINAIKITTIQAWTPTNINIG